LLFAYSAATALEPVRVAIVTSSGNTLNIDVELFDYSTNTSLYTKSVGSLTANSSGIISFIVDDGAPAWSGINSSIINSNVVLNVKTGGTLYAQYRIDQLMIVQAQSGSGTVTEPATAGKLIDISANNVISKMNNLQLVTVASNIAVDADNSPEGIFRFDMSAYNTFTITDFTNPVDGGVYTFHIVGAAPGGAVNLPTSFKKEDGTNVTSVALTTSKMITFYHYNGVNYTTEQ
jgi:hypothetical protein